MIQLDDKHSTLDISGGEKWRALRKSLSPTFTSGKLKAMMEPMAEVADATMDHLEKVHLGEEESGEVDVKKLFQG